MPNGTPPPGSVASTLPVHASAMVRTSTRVHVPHTNAPQRCLRSPCALRLPVRPGMQTPPRLAGPSLGEPSTAIQRNAAAYQSVRCTIVSEHCDRQDISPGPRLLNRLAHADAPVELFHDLKLDFAVPRRHA